MKKWLIIFLIGVSCLLSACGRKSQPSPHTQRITGKYDSATVSHSLERTLNLDLAEIHNNLGLAYVNQDKLDLAAAEFLRVISIKPSFAEARYNLAFTYALKDEKALAIESLKTAINQDKRLIERAKMNRSFDNIRESPEFQQLISSVE